MRLRIRDLVWLSVCLGRATELHLGYTDGVEHGGHVVGVRLARHLLNDPPQNLVPKVGVSMSRTCNNFRLGFKFIIFTLAYLINSMIGVYSIIPKYTFELIINYVL